MSHAAVRGLCDGPERLPELQAERLATEEKLQAALKEHADEQAAPILEATKRREEARSRVEGYYMTQQPYPHLTSFLTAFGQPPRETACACERREEANLDQALQLMNSDLIRDLYLAAFSREPREVELAKLIAHLQAGPNRRQAIEDLIWAVINTNEFMFQH